ncbi:MAG TPA: nucleoside triphosphate pyrophosphohydrolase [Gammaproteobacteria bacterium]|nr:nucleoside triphosphate pyrophosphohydrolase [Gammaproteobacteria bacterium]
MSQKMNNLLSVMAQLRHPENGCPWDLEQTYKSLVPHTLEEVHEVIECIEAGDVDSLKGELGDLLFQVVFYARLAEEQGDFSFNDVAETMADKLIRRHPHVFASDAVKDSDHQTEKWEAIKAAERQQQADKSGSENPGILAGVSRALPSLVRAQKLQRRAARVGFDWPDTKGVYEKIQEELGECQQAVEKKDKEHIEEELGDLLFSCVNLARHCDVDSETALRKASRKFESRFEYIESELRKKGEQVQGQTVEKLDGLWREAKRVDLKS